MKMSKDILKVAFVVVCFCLAVYVGGWVMFVGGIIDVVEFFRNGSTSMPDLGVGIMKIVFASPVGGLIAACGLINIRKG
jgi:hypothetical protein